MIPPHGHVLLAQIDADSETAIVAEELLWASSMPLFAPARVGKVHLRVVGEVRTLCGLVPGRPRLQFVPGPHDARCTRCAKRTRIRVNA